MRLNAFKKTEVLRKHFDHGLHSRRWKREPGRDDGPKGEKRGGVGGGDSEAAAQERGGQRQGRPRRQQRERQRRGASDKAGGRGARRQAGGPALGGRQGELLALLLQCSRHRIDHPLIKLTGFNSAIISNCAFGTLHIFLERTTNLMLCSRRLFDVCQSMSVRGFAILFVLKVVETASVSHELLLIGVIVTQFSHDHDGPIVEDVERHLHLVRHTQLRLAVDALQVLHDVRT